MRSTFSLVFALLLPVWLGLGSGCNKPPPPTSTTAQSGQQPTVAFYPSSGSPPWPVKVELAKNDADRAKGLMYRRELAPNTGMLFVFEGPRCV